MITGVNGNSDSSFRENKSAIYTYNWLLAAPSFLVCALFFTNF